MALLVLTYDLPPAEKVEAYAKWALEVTQTVVLKQPGIKEVRAYRDPLQNSPQVLAHYEFDSLESCVKFITSEAYTKLQSEARTMGVTNLSVKLWDASPVAPEPLKPTTG